MATNAPYYQLRGQFPTNATQFGADEDEYGLASIAHNYTDSTQTQHSADRQNDQNAHSITEVCLEDNHNLAELLEAATTAAGQAANANLDSRNSSNAGQTLQAASLSKGKRKRVSGPAAEQTENTTTSGQRDPSSRQKRAKHDEDIPTDPQLPGPDMHTPSEGTSMHSAAALFRRSSNQTTKKYTRPPMSKLFMSLQLTPENFLHLQAQAKAYMLDPAHPERQNCVGNRGKGDTDMVKLRLFNCVRDFLNDGVGEQFFGENVEKPGEKEAIEAARALGEDKVPLEGKLAWPRDGNKIISLVTPLLRRMVTNERQRMYAIETRKGGPKKKEGSAEAVQAHDNDFSRGHELEQLETAVDPTLAPTLVQAHSQQQYHSSPTHYFSKPNQTQYPQFPATSEVPAAATSYDMTPKGEVMLEIGEYPLPERSYNLSKITFYTTKNGAKLKPVIDVFEPTPNYSFEQLREEVRLLVKRALALYPRLRQETSSSDGGAGMGPEALRGLAVAATEIDNAVSNTGSTDDRIDSFDGKAMSNPPPTEPLHGSSSAGTSLEKPQAPSLPLSEDSGGASDSASMRALPPSVSTSPTFDEPSPATLQKESTRAALTSPYSTLAGLPPLLPRHTIRVLVSHGLTVCEGENDFENAKRDVGFAAWADGVMKVVVDFD